MSATQVFNRISKNAYLSSRVLSHNVILNNSILSTTRNAHNQHQFAIQRASQLHTQLHNMHTSASPITPDIHGKKARVCAVLGAQWGDEGKGKLVDILAKEYHVVARFNGGANAGHTLVVNNKKFAFHLLPCGILYENKLNVIGNGVVLHVPTLLKELESLHKAGISTNGRLKISNRAHLLFDFHQVIDGLQEKKLEETTKSNIGTTKRGIGPCYSSKATRIGVRVGELTDFKNFTDKYQHLASELQKQYGFKYDVQEELERYRKYADVINPMIVDSVTYMNQCLREGRSILAEGANAALLDLDFGTYPYVTSSSTAAGGICTGLGIPPSYIDTTIGIVKAYTTRVGGGPFPTELLDDIGQKLRNTGHEYGTTTGRPRRCGWLDIPVLQYSHALNNYRSINITKLDVLSDLDTIKIGVAYELDGKRLEAAAMPSLLHQLSRVQVVYEELPGWKSDISKCTSYNQLPVNAQRYLERISQLLNVPISWVGVGAGRDDMIAL